MSLLYGHLICALLTWIALVADGVPRLTPSSFARALVYDIRTFGALRVFLWAVVCLVMWWAIWFAWFAEWLEDRR